MIPEDWDLAIKMSRVRSQLFPGYERKAVKIFNLIDEDEEDVVLKFVQKYVEDKKVEAFHRARLIMVILARLGMYTFRNIFLYIQEVAQVRVIIFSNTFHRTHHLVFHQLEHINTILNLYRGKFNTFILTL